VNSFDAKSTARLVKLLGMCGSSHDGERAAAARKATELVHSLGCTWADVIGAPTTAASAHRSRDWRTQVGECLLNEELLRPRERKFMNDLLRWRGDLTEKQSNWLDAIHERVRRD
jgi:hypothetical protein